MKSSYFETDAKPIGEASRAEPLVFLKTALMVLLSIRQPWLKIPEQFQDVMQIGSDSKYLFGFKRDGYKTVMHNLDHFHGAVKNYDGDLNGLILTFMDVPGLGLAKASFLAQLTVGDGACLDTHNLHRIGKDDKFTRVDKSAKNILERIEAYNEAWRPYGNSAFWWDSWCDFIGSRYGITGAEVSALHRLPLYEATL